MQRLQKKDWKHLLKNKLVLFLLVVIQGCGYNFYIKDISSNTEITLQVNIFENYTYYNELTTLLGSQIKKEIISNTPLKIVNSKGKYIMNGIILSCDKEVLKEDENDNAIEYRITIGVEITLKDSYNNLIWKKYFCGEGTYHLYRGETENYALKKAVKDLSLKVIHSLIGGW